MLSPLYRQTRRLLRQPLIRKRHHDKIDALRGAWLDPVAYGPATLARFRDTMERFAEHERADAAAHADLFCDALPDRLHPMAWGDALYRMREAAAALYRHRNLFDAVWYDETYRQGGDDPALTALEHFILTGRYRGASPNPYFDYMGYLRRYPDLVERGVDACLHYTLEGWREWRDPGAGFQPAHYLAHNADVAAADICPLYHFLSSGRDQGRDPCPGPLVVMPEKRLGIRAGGALDPRHAVGTIVLVSHDAGVGGAQKVVQHYARWLRDHTGYSVKFVCMEGGALLRDFLAIAPTFVVDQHAPDERVAALDAFCGDDLRMVLLNTIVSAGFLKYWDGTAPVVGYIHELSKILDAYPHQVTALRKRAKLVIGGSEPVTETLRGLGFAEAQLDTQTAFVESAHDFEGEASRRAAKTAIGIDPETVLVVGCGAMHWRKAPNLFIDVAERVLADTGRAVHFLWVGGGPDFDHYTAEIAEKALGAHVTLTGHAPDVRRYLDAGDIFLLTSEEDPFPIVCLMAAQAQAPVICFDEAGGMPGFVARGAGVSVPFLDTGAMAKAVRAYLDYPELRKAHGSRGAELVARDYTIDAVGARLFHLMRAASGRKPAVSVVVPNYNYEAYLPQRLDSIASQSFQDFEVILLDDASSDGSVKVLRDWAAGRPAVRVVVNETNSGSPFIQWIKGMAMAEADLVWIAEADDFCDPDLLETLLPAFNEGSVHLGYVRSVPVDAGGTVMGDYNALYLDRINPGRWAEPYTATDHEEASAGLGIANCIPNASSVILRKFAPEPQFCETVSAMRMCGDWLFYLRAMRGGMVAYEAGSINYHRRHDNTVTAKTEGSPAYFDELQSVRDYVTRTYRLEQQTYARIAEFVTGDLDRFGIEDAATRARILNATTREGTKERLSVLFVLPDLSPGGGQMFSIRMANAWVAEGGRAVLLNVGNLPTHDKMLGLVDPRVAVIREGDAQAADLAGLCARWDIDLIHSAIWWADKFVMAQIEALPAMPWVVTMHGCHESILDAPGIDPGFSATMAAMMGRVDCWTHTTDKNTAIFDAIGWPQHHQRIPNGVPIKRQRTYTRADLGLREAAVVLCLATRAIPEKGWNAAVDLTQQLNREGHAVDLMLIGEGPARDAIALMEPDHVHLYGHVSDLHDYIALCDIGILPSFFVGESMPLVLLEMMGLGKPVVATARGEIPQMVGEGAGAAGITVPIFEDGTLDPSAFTDAVRCLVTDPACRAVLGKAARARFDAAYREEDMMAKYRDVYRATLHHRTGARD